MYGFHFTSANNFFFVNLIQEPERPEFFWQNKAEFVQCQHCKMVVWNLRPYIDASAVHRSKPRLRLYCRGGQSSTTKWRRPQSVFWNSKYFLSLISYVFWFFLNVSLFLLFRSVFNSNFRFFTIDDFNSFTIHVILLVCCLLFVVHRI